MWIVDPNLIILIFFVVNVWFAIAIIYDQIHFIYIITIIFFCGRGYKTIINCNHFNKKKNNNIFLGLNSNFGDNKSSETSQGDGSNDVTSNKNWNKSQNMSSFEIISIEYRSLYDDDSWDEEDDSFS